jgi:transcriptional regulator with XRE-family HTH domain
VKSLVEIFLKNLSFELQKRGVKQTELAKIAGLKQESISRLVNQTRRPNLQTVNKIAKALKLKPWELFVDYDAGEIGPLSKDEKTAILEYRGIADPTKREIAILAIKALKD